jgi:hypothetical protein
MNNGWTSRALARPLLSESRKRWAQARDEKRHRRRVADELRALTDRELLELGSIAPTLRRSRTERTGVELLRGDRDNIAASELGKQFSQRDDAA